jgi:predicted DNA-binding ArsR family transcriptional regulator
MIRLGIEALLGAGFYILGAEFSPRMYGEDIKLASNIDDVAGKTSVKDMEDKAEKVEGAQRVFHMFEAGDKLSDYQQEVYGGTVPFFKRTAELGLFKIIYTAEAEEHEEYRDKADQLIRDGKAHTQYVEIECNNTPLIFLTISSETGKVIYGDTLEGNAEDILGMYPENVVRKLPILKKLHNKKCDPMETYKAIMDFIT